MVPNKKEAVKAYDEVPNNEPVIPDVTVNEFKVALLPEVTTLRQLGIGYLLTFTEMPS